MRVCFLVLKTNLFAITQKKRTPPLSFFLPPPRQQRQQQQWIQPSLVLLKPATHNKHRTENARTSINPSETHHGTQRKLPQSGTNLFVGTTCHLNDCHRHSILHPRLLITAPLGSHMCRRHHRHHRHRRPAPSVRKRNPVLPNNAGALLLVALRLLRRRLLLSIKGFP